MPHYLIRHAHAVSDEENQARPLSLRGRKQVDNLCASLLADPSFQPIEIWHSPLLRAHETAAFLASGLGLSAQVIEKEGLQPMDDPEAIARTLAAERRDIAIVGHEPHLGILAGLMVGGGRQGLPFVFPKAGVMALRRGGSRWQAEWLARSA